MSDLPANPFPDQPQDQSDAMPEMPTGTVTFLFTDIEGSTRLWEEQPDAMRRTLARHDRLLRGLIEAGGGHVFKTVGDSFYAAFRAAPPALTAALAVQAALAAEAGESLGDEALRLRVRVALHTGAAEQRDHDYFGPALNRVARLLAAGHGGQTLLSAATHLLVCDALPPGTGLTDLGIHHLRDMGRAEPIYQADFSRADAADPPAAFPPLRGLGPSALPSNLPQQLTSFIGRERELADVKALLDRGRLVTLTGPGGGGKTRLSLQAAADRRGEYPAGTWLVELAPLSDPAQVPQAVAAALGIREQVGKPLTQTLTEALAASASGQRLLILDNCEHLLPACAALADALLRGCPDVSLLASSREALGIGGEQTYRVPSLSVPDLHLPPTPDNLRGCESVRLFLDRAALGRADFVLTLPNAPALASVCRRLDGIPLALELAAARVRSLSIEEINSRLDSRFRLLTGGSRTALPRQQTLRALIDWSYSLLTVPERALLRRLSVFAGGWTLEAAEHVCAGEDVEDWETLDLLGSLVDKSMALAETGLGAGAGRTRYRLLETVRSYARERLDESGETELLRTRHRDWCVAFVDEPYAPLGGYAPWRLDAARMATEADNLRAALLRCEEPGRRDAAPPDAEAEAAFRLARALFEWWSSQEHFREGREHLPRLLARRGQGRPSAAKTYAFYFAGRLALDLGDYAQATTLQEEALAAAEADGDTPGEAAARQDLAWIAAAQGDYARAHTLAAQSLALCRAVGDERAVSGVLHLRGLIAEYEGDFAAALAYYAECLEFSRRSPDRAAHAWNLHGMGYAALRLKDYPQARALLRESLLIFQDIGIEAGRQRSLDRFGEIAAAEGDWERAVLLLAAADAARRALSLTLTPAERGEYDRLFDSLRLALGPAPYAAAWAAGAALPFDEAVALALGQPAS